MDDKGKTMFPMNCETPNPSLTLTRAKNIGLTLFELRAFLGEKAKYFGFSRGKNIAAAMG